MCIEAYIQIRLDCNRVEILEERFGRQRRLLLICSDLSRC